MLTRTLKPTLLLSMLLAALSPALAQGPWTPPTPEELSMTSIPEVPGAPAVILFKEETAEDSLRMWSYYKRVKILTEGGKEQANVELPYVAGLYGWTVDSILGRTIHPDGTITMFSGKPYDKLIRNTGGFRVSAKVFTLPAVEVGSILEYRYKLRYDDGFFRNPDWYIQSDLYIRKAHYRWRPTDRELQDRETGEISNGIAWTPLLPAGAEVKQTVVGGANIIDLDVHDIKPLPHEYAAPPIDSISYRVLFYYTNYRKVSEYWANAGKRWSSNRDSFIGPNSFVKSSVKELVQPGDTDEIKLRKIYAVVAGLDNTNFTRTHTSAEDRAQGLKEVKSTDDILRLKRGNDDQLAMLFVAMARAAGLKASLMGVADRSRRFFLPSYLSLYQLDDDIAVVNVDGKDMFFDPGQRYCSFGQLAWKHQLTGGLRQSANGPAIAETPSGSFKDSHVTRVADLTIDEHGAATGTVLLTFTGNSALLWRQDAAEGDETSLKRSLREYMERMLPGGMEVKVGAIENLTDAEKPLKIAYDVSGNIGSATGKRLLIPANLFESNEKPRFTAAKRELPVDLEYGRMLQDAVRIKYPASLVIETAPTPDQGTLKTSATFSTSSKTAGNSITTFRNLTQAGILYSAGDYPELRAFYNKLEAKDAESLIFTKAPAATPPAGN